ncbi:MAG: hypothetical protein ACYC4R_13275 [Anaerolineae bacterium]
MRPDTIARLCDTSLVSAREQHMVRMDALFEGRLAEPIYLWGITGAGQSDAYQEPERWLEEALDDLADRATESLDAEVYRPLVIEFWPYGVHFVDRMFGAHVHWEPNEAQWWCDYLETPIGTLQPPDLAQDETWQLAMRVAKAFLKAGVTAPLFGLPIIASALNIAVNLYGEAFLIALHETPEAARHDLEVINALLCTLHRWFLERVPAAQIQPTIAAQRCQPQCHGQLCGCTTHLLAARTYREFVADLDDALLSVYPGGGMIHLCGAHLQHLPVWRAMPSLRAVQVNDRAAEDLAAYFQGLRDDQMLYLNPTETMTTARALEITGGRRLVVVEKR